MINEDVAIIGAGPGGIAAAIQLKRYGIDPVVFEKDSCGGLLNNAFLVENYPGFPEGISGRDLTDLFSRQAQACSVRIIFEQVTNLNTGAGLFRIETSAGLYQAQTVIVASGTKPVKFTDLEIPPGLHEKSFYEIVPILDVMDKRIVIIGAGDAAFDYALNLSRRNHVTILSRSERIKALPLLVERAKKSPRININSGIALSRIKPGRGDDMIIEYSLATEKHRIPADLLVFAIGREPQLDFLPPASQSDNENLYFCGDVINGICRQTAISIGDGIRTAMRIHIQRREQS